jgi:hypothetical protein
MQAWQDSFGDAKGFEERWRKYWRELPDDPTADRYAMATASTLSSFLARAVTQKQTFSTFDAFEQAAQHQMVKYGKDDWLPPALLKNALADAKKAGKWKLVTPTPTTGSTSAAAKSAPPQLVCEMEDGTRVVGSFALKGAKIDRVWADIDESPKRVAEARALLDKGKKAEAKTILQDVIKKSPKSWAAEDARKMMPETK